MAQLRVSHVGICVSDWKRSLRFYHDVLGFRYVHELELSGEPASTLLQLEDLEFRAITLEREGLRIELLHYERPGHVCGQIPRPMNQLGLTHLSLRAHDLSPEGIGIEPASELASGERVHIALPRPRGESPLFLWARVVRSDETGARGLAFESATPFDRNRLEKLGDAPCLASIER